MLNSILWVTITGARWRDLLKAAPTIGAKTWHIVALGSCVIPLFEVAIAVIEIRRVGAQIVQARHLNNEAIAEMRQLREQYWSVPVEERRIIETRYFQVLRIAQERMHYLEQRLRAAHARLH